MPIEQIIVLAIVQGITEFLPISSSGHLILVPALTGWKDQGLATDVMVHVGSLFAILVYFWRDVLRLLAGTLDLMRRQWTTDAKLALYIAAAERQGADIAQPARQQTIGRKRSVRALRAGCVDDVLRLVGEFHQSRHAHLHPVR